MTIMWFAFNFTMGGLQRKNIYPTVAHAENGPYPGLQQYRLFPAISQGVFNCSRTQGPLGEIDRSVNQGIQYLEKNQISHILGPNVSKFASKMTVIDGICEQAFFSWAPEKLYLEIQLLA